jgi:uncharacterized membrane protein
MKSKKASVFPVLLLLVSAAAATTISNEDIVMDLETNEITVNMKIEDLTTDSFNYQTVHEARNVEAYFNGEKKDCSVESLAVGSTINCETDLKENFTVELIYKTSGLVNRRDSIRTFSYSQSIYRPIRNYSLKVLLPEGTGLVDQANITTPVTQPAGAELGNMDGRRFFVKWNTNPELGEIARFQIVFERLEEPDAEGILPVILGIAVILALAVAVYRRKNKVETSNVLDELDTDQEMVIDMLKEKEGEMLQKDIVNKSDYSKAKISGLVKELEDLELISKEKEGRSNKVVLKEKFRD